MVCFFLKTSDLNRGLCVTYYSGLLHCVRNDGTCNVVFYIKSIADW